MRKKSPITIFLMFAMSAMLLTECVYAYNMQWLKNNPKKAAAFCICSIWYVKNVYVCRDASFWKQKTFIKTLEKRSVIQWNNIVSAIFSIFNSHYNQILFKAFWSPAELHENSALYQKTKKSCKNSLNLLKHLDLDNFTTKYQILCDALNDCNNLDAVKLFLEKTKLSAQSNNDFTVFRNAVWNALKGIASNGEKIKAAYENFTKPSSS